MSDDEKVLFDDGFDEEIDFGDLDDEDDKIYDVDDESEEESMEYLTGNESDENDSENDSDGTYEISYDEFGITEEDDDNEIVEEIDSDSEEDSNANNDECFDDENDTVAMVSRNSERVQTGKSIVHNIPIQEREIVLEQPMNVTSPATQSQQIHSSETIRREQIAHPAVKPTEKNKVSKVTVINTVVSVVTLCAVAFGLLSGMRRTRELEKLLEEKTKEIESLRENADKEEIREVVSIIDEDKPISEEIEIEKEKILFWDNNVGYSWTPVLSGLKQNNYKDENFSINNRGHMEYTVNGDTSSYFGIDVSSYQGEIDWNSVREDGVEFAILRLGYRGYGEEGNIRLDETFIKNYEGAHDAGIDVGVYFFSQAISVDEAIEEAHFVLENLGGRGLEYPVVFDWETVETINDEDIPRTEDVMPNTLTLSAIAFCETIQSEGYDAMIYTNKKQATIKYDMRQLSNYPVWFAYYDTKLNYCYDFDIWQYGTGTVDGIEGEVDFNIAMIK